MEWTCARDRQGSVLRIWPTSSLNLAPAQPVVHTCTIFSSPGSQATPRCPTKEGQNQNLDPELPASRALVLSQQGDTLSKLKQENQAYKFMN